MVSRREKFREVVVNENTVRVELPRCLPKQREVRSESMLHFGVGTGHVRLAPLRPMRMSGWCTILEKRQHILSAMNEDE